MKKIKRIFASALLGVLLTLCFTACGADMGEPLLTAEGYKSQMSINIFELYLARMKTEIYLLEGENADTDTYWDKWVDVSDGETYNTHYTKTTLEAAKEIFARVLYFEEQGLKLPDSYIDEIDAQMESLVQTDGNGSKNELNKILGQYGVNYDMLRESKIMLAKIEFVRDYVFGANGEKLGSNIIEDYYKAHYGRYKQLYIKTWEYKFVTDENDEEVWYLNEGENNEKISYDSSQPIKKDDKGQAVKDEYGDAVHIYTDANGKEHIAYVTSGADRKIETDSYGNKVKNYYTGEKLAAVKAEAEELFNRVKGKTADEFEAVMKENPQYLEENISVYPDGNYIPDNMATALSTLQAKLFELKTGEQALVEETNDGYHIIMRYELEKLSDVASKDNYEDLFIGKESGTYIFMEMLCEEQLTKAVEKYKPLIKVDEKLYKTVDIKSAKIMKNGYYY